MSTVIFASTPTESAVRPLLFIATSMARRGLRVIFMTAPAFRDRVERANVEFVAMGSSTSPRRHDARLASEREECGARAHELLTLSAEIRDLHIDPVAHQHAALQQVLDSIACEEPAFGSPVLIHDSMFLGAWPLHLGAPGRRPGAVLALGVTPLPSPNTDVAMHTGLQAHLDDVMTQCGATRKAPLILDGRQSLPDRFLQLSIAALEQVRGDARPGPTFIGHVPPARNDDGLPAWWPDLDTARPVVLVTPGLTLGGDLDRLTRASLHALRNESVLIILSVDWDAMRFGPLPDHVRAMESPPLLEMLPWVDVVISNGEFDEVQHALSHGVPVIVAADNGARREVGACVAQANAGLHLMSSLPSAVGLRDAVRSVVESSTALAGARALRDAYANHDAVDALTWMVMTPWASAPSRHAPPVPAPTFH